MKTPLFLVKFERKSYICMKIVRDTRGQYPTCFSLLWTRTVSRNLTKKDFLHEVIWLETKSWEKEDKTISLICSSFFQMIKRRKMMSSLIPFLARTGLDLSTLLVLQDFQAWNKQKYLYQSYPSDFKATIAIKCQRHQSCQSHKSCQSH